MGTRRLTSRPMDDKPNQKKIGAKIVSWPEWISSGTTFMSCTNHKDILQKALAEREEFLRRHPRQRAYQTEIDRILDKSGDINGRLASLRMLMEGKLLEIQNELIKLNSLLQDRTPLS